MHASRAFIDKTFSTRASVLYAIVWGTNRMDTPVFAENGTRTDLCFQRRRHPETPIQVHLSQPETCTRNKQQHAQDMQRQVRTTLPAPVPFIPTERLFAVEYSNSSQDMTTSLVAWKALLRPLFLPSETTTTHLESSIRTVLQRLQNTRSPPGPHRSVIYNIDWVREQAQSPRNPLLRSFLRGD